MTKKERQALYALIRRELRKQTDELKDHLDYAIREEAQLHVLKEMARHNQVPPS